MQCMKSQNLQRVSCWSLLGRKMSSVQPLSPYLQGNPIKPTIFSSAWLGASTKVCLQILQLLSCCVFLFSREVCGNHFGFSLAREAVEVSLPALGHWGGDEATALEAGQQGQQVLVLHQAAYLRRNPWVPRVILNCVLYLSVTPNYKDACGGRWVHWQVTLTWVVLFCVSCVSCTHKHVKSSCRISKEGVSIEKGWAMTGRMSKPLNCSMYSFSSWESCLSPRLKSLLRGVHFIVCKLSVEDKDKTKNKTS